MITDKQLREILRKECSQAGSIVAWAKRHGVSFSYVSEVLRGKKEPGPAILAILGYRRVMLYEKTERLNTATL